MVDISNTVSGPVLIGLSAVIAGIGKVIVDLYQIKHKATDAKNASEKAVKNTENVSNGFARSVDTKLNRIIKQQDKMDETLRDHLQWHIEQYGKEKP